MDSMPWKPRWTAPVCTAESHAGRGIEAEQALPRLCRSEDLTMYRKSVAYGDIGLPELDAEEVASRIEAYIESISALIEQRRAQ